MSRDPLQPSPALRAELASLLATETGLNAPDLIGPVPDATPSFEIVEFGMGAYRLVRVPTASRPGALWAGGMPAYPRTRCAPDLDAIRRFGIDRLCCLVPESHIRQKYGLIDYIDEVRACFGQGFMLLEIGDYSVPPGDDVFDDSIAQLDEDLTEGRSVLVHCGAGCGRTGIVVAALLVRGGLDPLVAVRTFRALRGCGPETREQIAYIARFATRLQRM